MSNAFRLLCDRFRNELIARPVPVEQIAFALKPQFSKQATHRTLMRLKRSIGQDVRDLNPTLVQFVSNEKGPMAIERFLLGAHQRNAVPVCATQDPLQSITKPWRARDQIITNAAVFIAGPVIGLPTQFATEIDISDSGSLESPGEFLAIELGIEAAVWSGAHIGDGGHAVQGQKFEKNLQRMVGVTDRQNGSCARIHDPIARRVR